LLVTTNYSAYISIAKSYIMKEKVEETKNWILNSVDAAKISDNNTDNIEEKEDIDETKEQLSINKYKKELDSNSINFDVDITTLDNRIIIPKMWKNIPLLDIKNRSINGQNELNEIFMEELENGVIRYPWSAKPWENWLSFIFWHSSNFPWLDWDYNDVFATLDRVMLWDEVIIYYEQKKYVFKIRERAIIKPGDVGILKRNNNKPEIAIMTCRPIWTTLNRFVIVWELVG
jgi:sortase (surface protein transpeptidase)